MHVELLGQLGQRLLALHGGEGHLRLEGRGVVPARSSRHRLSLPAAIPAAVRQKLHSSPLSRFPEPALSAVHMACLQEGLLPSRTGRRPACATRSPRRRRLLKRPLSLRRYSSPFTTDRKLGPARTCPRRRRARGSAPSTCSPWNTADHAAVDIPLPLRLWMKTSPRKIQSIVSREPLWVMP